MADKPIISIDIDDSGFDAFEKRFDAYDQKLKAQPRDWAGVGKGVKAVEGDFEKLALSFSGVTKALANPRLETVFGTFSKLSASVWKSWDHVAKSIEKSGKGISLFSRMTLGAGAAVAKFSSIGFGVAAAAAGATAEAAKDLSDQNREMRGLNLKPGEAKAFQDQYGTALGVDMGFIEKIARMQADASQHSKLAQITAGNVSESDIQADDPMELGIKVLREAAKARQALGANWATYSGASDIVGFQALNNASNRNQDFWEDTAGAYAKERDASALDQGKYDQGTAFTQHQEANWAEIKSAWDDAVITLAPALNKWSDAATNLAVNFLHAAAPQTKELIDAVGDAANGKPQEPAPDNQYPNTVTGGLTKFGYGLRNSWSDWWGKVSDIHGIQKGTPARAFHWDMKHPFGTINHDDTNSDDAPAQSQPTGGAGDFSKAESRFNLPPHVLRVIRQIESRGNDHAENPVTGALGGFQIMPDNVKRMNIDPFDPEQASLAAGQILRQQLDRYHGDMAKALAGYDGDSHIDQDAAKYGGAWMKGAKNETISYLYKAMRAGVRTNASEDDKAYIIERMQAIIAKHAKPSYDDTPGAGQGNYQFQVPVGAGRAAPHVFTLNVNAPPGTNVNLTSGMLVQ